MGESLLRVAIRVDASATIGSGHFMRCLTLADALKQRGAHVLFASRLLPDHLWDTLAARGHACAILDARKYGGEPCDDLTHSHWLGTGQASDAKGTSRALSGSVWDWLVVDHYALDARWEKVLRRAVEKILIIDDLADRQHDCDILLDQNFYADMASRYTGRVPAHCQLLLGPRYILLRDEFRQLRKQLKIRSGRVERLLVVFGGVDADNYTGRILEAIADLGLSFLRVDVVIGAQHPFREQIVSKCSGLGFSCHEQTDRMAELMAATDLAIGACGFTSYELAAMQVPAILIPVTDIQARVAKQLSEKGIAYTLFPRGTDIVEQISAALKEIIESSSSRASMSRACHDFLDAGGTKRVANKIFECTERT